MSAVRKLAVHVMSRHAIPDGGGLADGIRFLSDPQRIKDAARAADLWVQDAIRAVREAEDPNPWRDADDEAIAAEILRLATGKKP